MDRERDAFNQKITGGSGGGLGRVNSSGLEPHPLRGQLSNPEIPAVIAELHETVHTLFASLDEMQEELAMILAPTAPEAQRPSDMPGRAFDAPLAQQLGGLIERLRAVQGKLVDIRSRIRC